MPLASSHRSYALRVVLLLTAVFVLRLLYAALFAVNPAGDEAYYWDWGRHLDYGYYSKPPLIAWLYALVDWIGGGSLFAIRATAALLGTLSLYLLFRLAESLFDARTGWIAVLLGLATPANSVLSFFLTIDAPLVFFWTIALWAFWSYVAKAGGRSALMALFLALALGHLCKQMMMIFPLLALIFLCITHETRPLLKRGALWLTLFASYLSLIPPLLWNARHDWITFQHTGHHFHVESGAPNVLMERVEDFFSFLGTQMGVLSPGTAFVLGSLCVLGIPRMRKADKAHRFLLVFAALPLAAMVLLAMRQEMQPNWAGVFYVSGLVLVAAWYSQLLTSPFPPVSWIRLLPATLATGFALVGYFYLASPLFSAFGNAGHKADPNRRLLGFEAYAAEFQKIQEKADVPDAFLLVVGHRDLASLLAFGLPDQPFVFNIDLSPEINSQYEIWNLEHGESLIGRDALILLPKRKTLFPQVSEAFQSAEKLGDFTVSIRANKTEFSVFLARDLKAWPQ